MKKTSLIIIVIALAALSRLIPFQYNFSPVAAIALFGGAFLNRRLALFIPVLSLFIGDLIMAMTKGPAYSGYFSSGQFIPVYLCICAMALIGGSYLKKHRSAGHVLGTAAASSLFFYLVTNLTYWYQGAMYPMNFQGLVMSYAAGLEFYKWTFAGHIVYTSVLFGGYHLLERSKPEFVRS
jgi:hypothetical protein